MPRKQAVRRKHNSILSNNYHHLSPGWNLTDLVQKNIFCVDLFQDQKHRNCSKYSCKSFFGTSLEDIAISTSFFAIQIPAGAISQFICPYFHSLTLAFFLSLFKREVNWKLFTWKLIVLRNLAHTFSIVGNIMKKWRQILVYVVWKYHIVLGIHI